MNGLTSLWRDCPSDRLVSEDLLAKSIKYNIVGDEDTYPLDCIAGRNFFLAPHKDYIVLFKAVGKTDMHISEKTLWREIAHLQTEGTSQDTGNDAYPYDYFYPYDNKTISRTGAQSFSSLRGGAGTQFDADGTSLFAYLSWNVNWNELCRAALIFDTSSIPDDAIFDRKLLVLYTKDAAPWGGEGESVCVTGFTPSTPGTLAISDYNTFSDVLISNSIPLEDILNTYWYGFYLVDGVINTTGYTNLMVRLSFDYDNTPPATPASFTLSSYQTSSDTGGHDPYLELSWHLPFEDTEPFVSGEIYHYKAVRVQNNQISYDSKIVHHAYDGAVAECVHDAVTHGWSSHNWTTLRNEGGSEAQNDPTVYGVGTGQFTSATGQDSWDYIQRSILLFNTTVIPDNAVITSGFLGALGQYKNNPPFNRLTLNTANGGESGSINYWFGRKANETVTSDAAQYWQGSRSIKCITPGSLSYEGIECNSTDISPGAPSNPYTFSIYLKGNAGGESLLIALLEYDSEYTYIDKTETPITITSSWARYSVTHTYSSSGVYSNILVSVNGTSAYTFWADGAQLECGSSATTFSLPGEKPTLDLSAVDASPADPYNIVAGDYNGTTFTRMVDDIAFDDFTDWEWNFTDLTTYGKSHILKDEPTSLMLISAAEVDNSAPVWTPLAELLLVYKGMFPSNEIEAPPYIAVWYNKQYSFTKSLAYEISGVQPHSFTKGLAYAIQKSYSFTKGLSYAIKTSTSFTKGLSYAIKSSKTFTEGLAYAIKRSLTFTKGLSYAVQKSYTITKGLSYAITWQKPTFTKGLAYSIQKSYTLTKGLSYAIQKSYTITKGLSYAVQKSYSITKGLAYSVKVSYSFNKGLAYAITGGITPYTFTKGLAYAVQKSYTFTKGLSYAILIGRPTFTKGLAYVIKNSYSFTKGLSYSIQKSYTITKGLSYAIVKPYTFTKGLSYAIKTSTSFTKGLSYAIKKSYTFTKGLSYLIGTTTSFTKGLAYKISTTFSFTKGLAYKIEGEIPEESVCVHITCDLNNTATIECDLNPAQTVECPTDDKEVTVECYLRCG